VSLSRRLAAAARWTAPSLVAAGLGTIVAGLVEGLAADLGLVGAAASAGYAALLAAPACLAGALAVRGLWAAWRPARLAPGLLEEGGGAPRLAGWILFLLLATFVVSWATFNGTRLVARWTTFQVDVVALALPVAVLVAAGVLAALSRPLVDLFAAAARALDRRARARLGRSLVTPRLLFGAALAGVAALVVGGWFVSVKPRTGPLDLGVLHHPVLALAITGAAHPAWRRLRRPALRRALAAAVAAGLLAILGAAGWLRADAPDRVLAIWSRPTVAGFAIDTLLDVDELRGQAALEHVRPPRRPGAPARDLILITIDTLRADRTPLAGGPAPMPALAELGGRGAVFTRAIAPGNVTRRSMPAMILGASPPRIHGRVVGWALRLDPRHVPLAERLAAAGYDTAGFFCCGGFWDPEKKTGYSRGIGHLEIDRDGRVITDHATRWLAARARAADPAPYFVWLHYLEPHNWMKRKDPGGTGDARARRLRRYDATLTDVDGFLADLLATIDEMPPGRRPIVVVTSDHGEGLGDHDAPFHSSDLYDTQLHVPLVIAGPGLTPRRIDEPVSLTDLTPTLLDLAGFVPPGMPQMDGRSLADLATGARAPDPDGGAAYAVMMKDRSSSQEARAVVRGRWKLIDGAGGRELYDLRVDPGETTNLIDRRPEIRAELERLLAERAALDEVPAFLPVP
jgi:arylsulfatase A-like enzyme